MLDLLGNGKRGGLGVARNAGIFCCLKSNQRGQFVNKSLLPIPIHCSICYECKKVANYATTNTTIYRRLCGHCLDLNAVVVPRCRRNTTWRKIQLQYPPRERTYAYLWVIIIQPVPPLKPLTPENELNCSQ